MSARGRINRSLQASETSLKALNGTRDPNKQQVHWEEFLLHWKRTVELLRSYCKENDKEHIRASRYKQRLEDPILNYAWEARNAEEHDALGSADPKAGSFRINALDRSKPVYIKNFEIRGGFVRDLKMNNGVACVEEGRLEMKPITVNGGKKIVEPPLGKNSQEICTYAMEFLAEYYREVF